MSTVQLNLTEAEYQIIISSLNADIFNGYRMIKLDPDMHPKTKQYLKINIKMTEKLLKELQECK